MNDEITMIVELQDAMQRYIGECTVIADSCEVGDTVTMVDIIGQGVADYSHFTIDAIDKADPDLWLLTVHPLET